MSHLSLRGAITATAALLIATLAVAGCSRDSAGLERGAGGAALVKGGLGAVLPGKRAAATAPVQAPNPAQLAQAALASVKGPVLLATFEAVGAPTVLGMVGENGTMRSYQTPDQRGVMLRAGLLAGTRGYGRDLMSADTDAVARLIRARQAGSAPRVQRYLDGNGVERPVPMTCTVTPGASMTQELAGIAYSGQQVSEHCEGSGAVIDNGYLVAADGRVLVSRQWVGPGLGYLVLQSLRD
ncbi:MAG: YjbF family lipoprotein [Paracoccaceae bacterium]|jgi:hypothetical protein|nr:YjbF family lipoprotein [Paracoccaceae bacterium]